MAQKRTDAWTELLRRPEFEANPWRRQKRLPERTKFQYVLASLGIYPPIADTKKWFPRQKHDEGFRIRGRISNNKVFAGHAFGKTMGVAHQDWTDKARAAFGLEEPPSPYEVACFTLGQYSEGAPFSPGRKGARSTRRFFQGVSSRAPRLHTSAFMWWLLGIGDEAIEQIIPGWDQTRADYIRVLMRSTPFALWALGTDLTPLVYTPRHARALLTENQEFRAERREIFDSTYVQTLLRLGRRPRPIERRIPDLAPVFLHQEEKEQRNRLLGPYLGEEQKLIQGNMWWFMVGMEKYPNRAERKERVLKEGWGYQAAGRAIL